MTKEPKRDPEILATHRGTGALCAEAQADGVPCFEVGKDCAVCNHAFHHPRDEDGDDENG
jgi:hypothetical protein